MKSTRTETTVKVYDTEDNLVSETTSTVTTNVPDNPGAANSTGMYL